MDIRRTGRLRQPTTMWLPLAALFFHQLQMAASDGTVSLKLISYINPKGKGSNNHCCDGKWFWCGSQCDHKFEICLDSAKNVGNCLYGKKNSGEIPNRNRISFGRTVGGLDNPLLFGFESWPGKMMLKFDVWDHDDNADDHVDSLSYIISTSAARSLHQSRAVRISIQHYTTMTAEVRVYCDPGYYGSRCDISCNPAEHPNGHYSCDSENGERICHAGWTGPTCEVGVDDCAGAVCENDGTCVDEHLSSWCDCQPGFVGKLCETEADECASSPCLNNSTCRDLINGFVCACAAGWTGPRCRKNINDCTNHSCRNGATCNDHLNGYTCSCPTGWTGERCGVNVDECLSSPCQGDATCVDLVGGYSCLCRLGTTGVHCLETVDACVSEPCENGSVCVSSSASGYACICPAGLTGRGCESAVDYCESRPCVNNATCVGLQGGYTCTCAGGWEGANCSIDVDECLHAPCKNGATCNNDAGGYFCACPPGWTGLSCGSEINECEQNRCLNNGSCVNHAGGYRCACVPGYTGDLCEVGVNSCEKRLCKNGARCLDHLNSHTCVCARGWKGKYCDVHLEECLCRNNGTCTNLTGDAECACISTWTGRHCETSLAEKDMEGTVILHQNEGHTRKTVEPEDGRRVSNETPGSSKEVVFYLSGDPDSFRDADLAAALTGLLSEYLEIARKDFKTRVEKITAVDKQHSDIIEVTAYVSRADHGVLPEDIEGFWENISKKKILEWLPHYLENASSLYQTQNLDKPSKQSWWQINWYVLVIAFLVGLFFTCVALYIIYLQRTRKQRDHQPTDDTFASVTALTETAAAATSPPVTATIPLHDIFQPSISPSSCAGARDSEQIFNNQLYTKDHSLPS